LVNVAAVLVRFTRGSLILALMVSIGAHWGVLQSVAWLGMIVSYSRDGSLSEAVNKTFDGRHPCRVCQVIKTLRSEEKQSEQKHLKPNVKLDVGLVWQPVTFLFFCGRERIPSPDVSVLSRREAPPKPRPRTCHSATLA
jgi:hypothetical protein